MTSLASTEIADKAIRDGEIDVYPEYVGTAYQTVLGKDAASAPASREDQFAEVKTDYEGRGLTALTPAPFNNGNAVACTKEAVNQYGIKTLTDLGKASANITYSANAEHLTRPDGLPLLKREYGSTRPRSAPWTSACATSRSRTARRTASTRSEPTRSSASSTSS